MNVSDWITIAPWRQRQVSLISIEEGKVTQCDDLAGKRQLAEHGEGILLVAWHGKWRTEVRIAGPHERQAISDALS